MFKKKEKKNNTLMIEGPIWKNILVFSIPLILGNLFQQCYNIVDSIIVSNVVGKEALAAVGSSGAVLQLLIGFCIGVSAGAGVVTSQFYGAKDSEGVRKTVHTTLAISVVAGLILTVVGVFSAPYILKWMGTPAEVYDMSCQYLQVFFGGIVFSVIYNMAAGILNAVGNSRRSLIYLIIAAISNIVLDILLVAVLKWGVIGAAIATDASQLISCIFIIRFLTKSKDTYRVNIKDIRFYDRLPARILMLGLPTGFQSVIISLSNVIVQAAVNSFGSDMMAGFAAYNKVDGFAFLPIMSMSMAVTTFVGQNYGAQKLDRVRNGLKTTIAMSVGYSIVAGAIMMPITPYILRIFTDDVAVIAAGTVVMKYFYPFYWLLAIFNSAAGALRGVGKTLQTMIISVFSLCVCRVIWIAVVQHFAHDVGLVMSGYPITWVIGSVIFLVYMKKNNWSDSPAESLVEKSTEASSLED